MIKRFLLVCLIPVLMTGCIQVGGYQIAKPIPSYEYHAPSKTRFSSSDLNASRKSGDYYVKINEQRNRHLPKAKPYTVRGVTYVPYASADNFEEIGIASWYGPGFHGKKTSNGETFNTNDLTAAHKLLPFNTRVKVTNLENGASVIVRINDRGPFTRERIIDLSQAAANKIGMIKKGTAKVHVQYVGGGTSSSVTSNYSNTSYGSSVTPQYVPSSAPVKNSAYNPYQGNAIYTPKDSASVSEALASAAGTGSSYSSGASESFGNSSSYADVPVYPETSSAPLYPDTSGSSIPPVSPAPSYDVPAYDNIGNNTTIIPETSYGDLSSNTVVGQLYLHLAVFKDRATAQRLSMELRRRKINNAIFNDNGFFVVQAGPYQNKTQVLKVKQYLHSKFPQSYLVIR